MSSRVVATLSAPRGAGPVRVTAAGEARELPTFGAGLDALAEAWAADARARREAARCPSCDTPRVPAATERGRRGLEWVADCDCDDEPAIGSLDEVTSPDTWRAAGVL